MSNQQAANKGKQKRNHVIQKRDGRSENKHTEENPGQHKVLGAMQRVKGDAYPLVKQSDALTLQRAIGNKSLRNILIQRHRISEGRRGTGEEEDEIQAKPMIQRQAAFGSTTTQLSNNLWGDNRRPAIQRKNGKTATKAGGSKAAGPKAAGPKGAGAKVKAADPLVKKAKKEISSFISGGPYRLNNYVPDTTGGGWGKFDAIYHPGKRLLNINMRIKFNFPDDKAAPGKKMGWFSRIMDAAQRKTRQQAYITSFLNQVHAGWSGQYRFRNVRPPQAVWGKLNPINVKINVSSVQKNQHYLFDAYLKKKGTANVSDNTSSQVEFFAGDLKAQPAFNLGNATAKGEIARVERNLPKIRFANNSAKLDSKYHKDLEFVAHYLKRMNTPKFNIIVVGHANKTGDMTINSPLSILRAQAVEAKLKAYGLTNHVLSSTGVGSVGATADGKWRKVDFQVSVPKGWQNVQDVTLHEFGHMLGLDDEYKYPPDPKTGAIDTRKKASHYGLVKKMFGKNMAEQTSKVGDTDSASVMYGGNEVRITHYVTLWKALYDTAAQGAGPKPKFGWKDWKLIG